MKKLLMTVIFAMTAIMATGCSTPNVKPFVDSTLQMNNLAVSEHREIELKLNYLSAVLKKNEKNEKNEKLKKILNEALKNIDNFKEVNEGIDEIFSLLVAYSNSIHALAGDKADGEKAIFAVGDNLSEISKLLKFGGVEIDIGGVVKKAAEWITEIQKQKGLEEAMALADPVIKKFSNEVSRRYSMNMIKIADQMIVFLNDSLYYKYPRHVVNFYRDAIYYENLIYKKIHSKSKNISNKVYVIVCSNEDEDGCIDRDAVEALDQLKNLTTYAKPIYDAYSKDVEAIKSWKEGRTKNFKKLAALSKIWAQEHSDVLRVLRDCNSLDKSCKNFDGISVVDIIKQ